MSDHRNRAILALVEQGVPKTTIARQYGFSAKRVEQICHRLAWVERPKLRAACEAALLDVDSALDAQALEEPGHPLEELRAQLLEALGLS